MGFLEDYARLAQTQVTTTPSTVGATKTTANWWETPGLTPDQYGTSIPRIDLGGSPTTFQSPDLWYNYFQGLDPAQQEQLVYLDSPITEEPFTTEQEPAAFDFSDYEPEEIPSWIPQATDQLLDFLETRMSDDFTSFTPAMRSQLSSEIGRELALSNRRAADEAARGGVWNSGIAQQRQMEGVLGGMNVMGQAQAAMEGRDEQARQWAAGQLQSFTQPAIAGYQNYLTNFASLAPQFAGMMNQGVFMGPDVKYDDPTSWFGTSDAMRRFEEELARLQAEGDLSPEDIIGLFLQAISTGMIGG